VGSGGLATFSKKDEVLSFKTQTILKQVVLFESRVIAAMGLISK
jgi:hypothetical protein